MIAAPFLQIFISDSLTIGEVVVKGSRIVHKATGYKVSLSNNENFRQMNLYEALQFMPGLYDAEGRLMFRGKDVGKVYINNREVRMDAERLQQYLNSYSARYIKEVEVITSAGADVEAESSGMAVIKVTTSKIDDGGNLTVSANGRLDDTSQSFTLPRLNLQMRNGRWSTYAVASLSRGWMDMEKQQTTSVEESDYQMSRSSDESIDNWNRNFTLGIGYDFSVNDILTVEGDFSRSSRDSHSNAYIQERASAYAENGKTTDGSKNGSVSADYCHSWKSGDVLFSGLWASRQGDDGSWQQRKDDPLVWRTEKEDDTRYTLFQCQADLSQNLGRTGKLKAGAFANSWKTSIDTRNLLVRDGQEDPYATYSDLFDYREHTLAAYASYDYRQGRFSGSFGLRFEHKVIDPESRQQADGDYKSTHDNLFPSVRLGYNLNPQKGHSLEAHYSRTFRKPSMHMLNPGIQWTGAYEYRTGNPYMEPASNHELGIGLTLSRFYSLSVGWMQNAVFNPLQTRVPGTNIIRNSYVNGETTSQFSVALSAMKMIGRLMVNSYVSYTHYAAKYEELRRHYGLFNALVTFNYRLSHGYSVNGNCMYMSGMKGLNFSTGDHVTGSLNVSKAFMKNRLTASLGYSYNPRVMSTVNPSGLVQKSKVDASPHAAVLSLVYRTDWGNRRAKISRSKSAASDEKDRMKGE